MIAGYVDPLRQAHVTPERIDMGVDYAGTGTYDAIGRAIITQINPGGWGGYGNFVEYKLLAGPDKGKTVYYAEGVQPVSGLHVGEIVPAGAPVVSLIPGWHSGTEIGYGGAPTAQNTTYAASLGGGYHEGDLTAAGQAFSNLVQQLGGPPGLAEGRTVSGTYQGKVPQALPAGASGGGGGLPGPFGALGAIGQIADFIAHPLHALVTIALVIAGAFLLYKGTTHTLGADDNRPRTKTRVIPV